MSAQPRAPDWSECEFAVLLGSGGLSDEEVAALLPKRSAGAVAAVRGFLDSAHRGGSTGGLPRLMLQALERRSGFVVCPRCRTVIYWPLGAGPRMAEPDPPPRPWWRFW